MSVADHGGHPDPVLKSFHVDQLEEAARLVGTQVERILADGTSITVTLGDVSGDGTIDEEDFELLRQLVSDDQEGEERRRHISPRVLAACDLDGDGVADVLRKATRTSDVLCRFGGDEFLVLLDHLETGRARAVSDRILAMVREARVPTVEGSEVRLGVSIGVAPF